MKKSPVRAVGRPNFYLLVCSTLLLMAGLVSLTGGTDLQSGNTDLLLRHGWRPLDATLPCPPGSGYFELTSDDASFEAYRAPDGTVLASKAAAPGDSFQCRSVNSPHFIQEIL